MKFFILNAILLLPSLCLAQFKISGTIQANNEALPFATLEVYTPDSKFVAYSISNKNGEYEVSLDKGVFMFAVNFIGYSQVKKEIIVDKTINLLIFN